MQGKRTMKVRVHLELTANEAFLVTEALRRYRDTENHEERARHAGELERALRTIETEKE